MILYMASIIEDTMEQNRYMKCKPYHEEDNFG